VSLATEPGDQAHASAYVPIAQALRQQAAAAHGAAG
jgi:hypothetical protein